MNSYSAHKCTSFIATTNSLESDEVIVVHSLELWFTFGHFISLEYQDFFWTRPSYIKLLVLTHPRHIQNGHKWLLDFWSRL